MFRVDSWILFSYLDQKTILEPHEASQPITDALRHNPCRQIPWSVLSWCPEKRRISANQNGERSDPGSTLIEGWPIGRFDRRSDLVAGSDLIPWELSGQTHV